MLELHKFDINCDGQPMAWAAVVRRMAQNGEIRLLGSVSQRLILSSSAQDIFIDYYVDSAGGTKFRVKLPAGYAPLIEMGARFQLARKPSSQTGAGFELISSARASEPAIVHEATALPENVFSKVSQFALPIGRYNYATSELGEQLTGNSQTLKTSDTPPNIMLPPAKNSRPVSDLRIAAGSEVPSANAWSTTVVQGVGIRTSTDQSVQQSMIATILGLALITSLVSGIGWLATQRILTLRARQSDPYQIILRREFTDLTRPDAQMCGELVRTCQELIEEIQARSDEINGAAPLRRVLLREVKSMEQFLMTTLRTSPEDPREWRRMRLRLQRVVTDLIRLKDIADSARRSLTTAREITNELPRDKQEAYEVLGANPEASERILKRLVDALRATWHPDLATSEDDRAIRNLRITQINVAWDLITEKRVD